MDRYNRFIVFVLVLLTVVSAHAFNISLQWDASPSSNVAGYKIYWDTRPNAFRNYSNVGNALTVTLNNLDNSKTYWFAATAYNGSSLESVYSNIVDVNRIKVVKNGKFMGPVEVNVKNGVFKNVTSVNVKINNQWKKVY